MIQDIGFNDVFCFMLILEVFYPHFLNVHPISMRSYRGEQVFRAILEIPNAL